MNMASELRTELPCSKATTGLPVTAIGYNPAVPAVPDKVACVSRRRNKVVPRELFQPRPLILDKSEDGAFYFAKNTDRGANDTMIQIENLKKTYQGSATVEALRGINARIEDGDIFGIIGLSGAGKSTLLRCIALLETPTEGRILIDGRDISSLRGKELNQHRGQIGVIFQGYNLLMQRTVAGNVAFPLEIAGVPKREIHRRVAQLLDLVDLADKADSYPAQLSGGQRQRVAIARALAGNPRVLLCDEPTSALDSFTTKSILDLLRDINRKLGVTIIIITHEIGVVKQICSRVAVIESGLFAEHGAAAEVLSAPKSLAARQLIGIGGAL